MLIYKFSHFGNHKKKILYVSIYLISSLTGGPMKRHKTLQMQRLFRKYFDFYMYYDYFIIPLRLRCYILRLCWRYVSNSSYDTKG